MVNVIFDKKFIKIFSKIKDNKLKNRIIKQIKKVSQNLDVGKPMRNTRKGTRELYIKPFKLSYAVSGNKKEVYMLDLYHKKFQ